MSIRESIISIGSRMINRGDEDTNFDVMSLNELTEMQDNILQKIWMLTLENDVYERYLTRYNPTCVRTIMNLLERARYTRRVTQRMIPRSSGMSFRESILSLHDAQLGRPSAMSIGSVTSIPSIAQLRTPSLLTIATQGDAAKITTPHRISMAKKEVEELRKVLEQFKNVSTKEKAYMRGQIEEIEIRVTEVYEAKEDFEEDVVTKGVDPITGKIPAERVIRFIDEWLRSANTIIERLRLKTATVRMHIRKAKRQLVQRRALGESLHSIDFQKLNIENQDFEKTLEEKSTYVIDMKRIAGRYHLKLTQQKQKLNDLMLKLNDLKKEYLSKQEQMKDLNNECAVVEPRVKRMDKQLTELIQFMEKYEAPDILDFVQLHEEFAELKKVYKLLQRRRNIDKVVYDKYVKQRQTNKRTHFNKPIGEKHHEMQKKSDTIPSIIF